MTKQERDEMLAWYAKMNEASQKFSPEERAELEAWEAANLDGATVATSDWPGWEKYIGKSPHPASAQPKKDRKP